MMSSTWGGWLATAVVVLSLLSGCNQDPYRCGVAIGAATALCDGPGEVCVCANNRCATADTAACPDSGFRWTRGDGACLTVEQLTTHLPAGVTEDAAMCPGGAGRPVECGLTAGITCLAGEECVCSTNRCARRDDQCLLQQSRHRYVDSGMCVTAGEDLPASLAPKTDGTTVPGLCSASVRCGRPGATSCLVGETCVCQTGRCARPDPCGSGLAYVDGLRECVQTSHTAEETLAPVRDGLVMECPSNFPCGLAGEVPCRPGEVCVCATNRCARESRDEACMSRGARWTYVDDDSCVTAAVSGTGALLNYPRPSGASALCSATPCNGSENNCLLGETCICKSGRCARGGDASCAAELRYVDQGLECVPPEQFPETYVATNAGDPAATCIGVPSCGLIEGMVCNNDQICVCATHRCARRATDETCTFNGARWTYVDDDSCVEAAVAGSAGILNYPLGEEETGVCTTSRCDGTLNTCLSGETCVCHSGRCARQSAACEGSLQYVDRPGCVPATDFPLTFVAPTPDQCATAAPCGVPGGADCGSSQVCVCGTKRCAVADDTCLVEGSRYRHADDETCVPPNPGEVFADPGMLCGAAPCNVADNTCAAGETCLCSSGQCARADETCASEGSRLRGVDGGDCASATDAAFSAAAPNACPARQACGTEGSSCLGDEVCDCLTGACLMPDDACATSGHRTLSGDCVVAEADLSGVLAEGAANCAERAHCGRDGDAACEASEVCVCTTNRCARVDNTCVPQSRLRDVATDACVSADNAVAAISPERFCSELGCGVAGGVSCAVGEFCLCGGNECALLDDACESRFRLLDGTCSESGGVRNGVLPTTSTELLLCDEPELPAQCGVASGAECRDGDVCVCAAPYRDCAYREPSCADAGYAWRGTGGCVGGLTQEDIESAEVDDEGVCVAPSTGESR